SVSSRYCLRVILESQLTYAWASSQLTWISQRGIGHGRLLSQRNRRYWSRVETPWFLYPADNSTKDGRPHRGTARAGRCNPAGLPRCPERRLGLVEAIAAGSEGPQHEVVLPRPFAVSKFDVTFADWAAARNLWDACVAVGGCPQEGRSGRGPRL